MKNIPDSFPLILCPFPQQIHPSVTIVHQHLTAWVRSTGLIETEGELKDFANAQFAWMTARYYPAMELDDLIWVSEWFTWFILLDDQLDQWEMEDIRTFKNQLLSSMLLPAAIQQKQTISPFTHTFSDMWEKLFPRLTTFVHKRLIKHIEDHIEVKCWERENRIGELRTNISQYIEKRLDTGGSYISYDLAETGMHIRLSEEAYMSQELQWLMRITSNIMCWINDIYSLEKELAAHDPNNLVQVIRQMRRVSWRKAIMVTETMIAAEMRHFQVIEHHLPGYATPIDREIRRFVAVLRSSIRGALDWAQESGRYTSLTAKE